jgi:hypothetical protein
MADDNVNTIGTKRKEAFLTYDMLRAALSYDPDTGMFVWKYRAHILERVNSRVAGKVAGSLRPSGYLSVQIEGESYQIHRLAWLYMTGEWPKGGIDHKDLNRSNNQWSNLRCADQSKNMANQKICPRNTSGFKGVSWNKEKKKWQAYIKVNKKRKALGYFSCPELAHNAYCSAAQKYFGEFARFE